VNNDKIHFYLLSGVICIIVGAVSLVYSYIIPTTAFPYNAPASLTFTVIGIAFIVLGIILILFRRRVARSQKQSVENKGG